MIIIIIITILGVYCYHQNQGEKYLFPHLQRHASG